MTEVALAPRPAVGLARHWTAPPVDDWIDESGIRVLVCDSGPPGVVSMQVLFHRGDATEAATTVGAMRLATRLVGEGAAGLDAAALAARFEELAAGIGLGVSHFETTASVTSLAETATDALAQLAAVVAAPHFDPRAFEFVRMLAVRGVAQARSRPASLAAAARSDARFGAGSPWSRRSAGTAASLSALTVDDVAAAHEAVLAAPATLVVAGDAAAVEVASLVQAVAAAIPGTGTHPPVFPTAVAAAAPARILLVDRPGAPQSVIRAGHAEVVEGRDPRTTAAVHVLDKMLTGGGSRLNQLLREQRAVTYGVHGSFGRGRNLLWLDIDTDVERAATGIAVSDIVEAVTTVAAGDTSADEVATNAAQLVASRVLRLQSTPAIASAVAGRVTHDLPADWATMMRDALLALTVDDVHEVARAFVHPERLQIAVVGDAATIREDLDATGLPVVDVDPSAWFDGGPG